MKDSFVLNKCFKIEQNKQSGKVASLYERFYPYWDPTTYMDDMTGRFSDFPSSPFMEILKQQPLMESFIQLYFLNKDLYDEITIERNKCILMMFFIQINNLVSRLYLANNQSEFAQLDGKIHHAIRKFTRETVPYDPELEYIIVPERYKHTLLEGRSGEPSIFSNLMIALFDHSFYIWLRTKYEILSIIQENIDRSWSPVDIEKIRSEIEKMILAW